MTSVFQYLTEIAYFQVTRITGGAEGDRTLDLRIANATLSQLSYRPVYRL